MTNRTLIRVAKRLSTLLFVPLFIFGFALMMPLSIFTWIITGKDIDEQMGWMDDKSSDYWEWVKSP